MKRFILQDLILVALLLCSAKMMALTNNAEEKSTTMKIGYTQGDLTLNVGSEFRVYLKGAIQFPAEYMQRLKGNRITDIRLAIGDKLKEHENDIFITKNLKEKPIYTQNVDRLEVGWNEITLNTPFEITGEELFIGFSYIAQGDVTSLDGGTDNNYADWLSIAQSANEERSWGHQGGGCLNLQAIVKGDNLPQNDASLFSISAKKYAAPGKAFPIDMIIRNMAAADINQMTVTYTIEGQSPVTTTIDGISIATNDLGIVPLENIIIDESSIYDLNIKIDKINGMMDENDSDNTGKVERIFCRDEYTNRKILLEQYSTMLCKNCPSAHLTIEQALKYKRDIIRVVHHAGYGTDDLTIAESNDYLFFFKNAMGNGSYYAPAMMLDRTNMASYGADNGSGAGSPGPAFFVRNSNTSKLIEQSMTSPALVSLSIDRKYNPNNRLLTVSAFGEVTAENVSQLGGDNICLNIVLTEDSILGEQESAPNPDEYYHSHAIRKVITSTWGDPIEFTGNLFHSKEYTFTLPEEWVDKKMHVIAFIANSDQKDPNNCKVYNADEIDLIDSNPVSLSDIQQEKQELKVYSNPSDGYLYINGNYDNAVIYDTAGNMMRAVTFYPSKIDVNSLDKGIYFIRFNIDSASCTHKFLIVR